MDPLSRILIVDDDPAYTVLLEKILKGAGYENVRMTNDPVDAVDLCRSFSADVLMLDLHMPIMDGFEVLRALPEDRDGVRLPVIVLSSDSSSESKLRALAGGAQDFINKPFDDEEVVIRVQHLLRTRSLEVAAKNLRELLELRVAARAGEALDAHRETILRLAMASEYRDDAVGEHILRVGRTTALIAAKLDQDPVVIDLFRTAATLHDVGKIAVPDSVLLKPGPLDDHEWRIMKTHSQRGHDILDGSNSPILVAAAEIALMHREKWDGSGYPSGLSGTDISLSGRLVAVADVFDALMCERPYKKAWTTEDAVAEIKSQSGRHFDPKVVDAFLELDPEFLMSPVDREEFFRPH